MFAHLEYRLIENPIRRNEPYLCSVVLLRTSSVGNKDKDTLLTSLQPHVFDLSIPIWTAISARDTGGNFS